MGVEVMKVLVIRRNLLLIALVVIIYLMGFASGRHGVYDLPASGKLSRQMPIFYVETKAREVCFTFDISWGNQTLPLVLKVLEEYQVPATFFLSGPWAERAPDLVRSIVAGGHEIASHGDRHINLSQYSQAEVQENIAKAQKSLLSVVDHVAPYFRPPNGDYDDLVIDTARGLGFETVIWAVDSLDWKNPGPDYMVKRVMERSFSGAIILCHASDSSKQIQQALPGMITGLRSKGYKLVTLSQLMKNGEPGRRDPR